MLRFLHDVPVWAKFSAASGILLLCLIGLGASANLTLERSARGLERLSTVHLDQQQTVSELTHDVIAVHVKVFRYVAGASNGVSERLLGSLSREVLVDLALIRPRLERFGARPDLPPAEQLTASVILEKWSKYSRSAKETIEAADSDPPIATMLLSGADEDFQDISAGLQSMAMLVSSETQSVSRALAAAAETKTRILRGGGLIGIALGLLATVFFAGSVVKPIRSVTRAMTRISSGNLDVDVGYRQRKDEIGQMVEAIATFRQDIDRHHQLLREREGELRTQNVRFDAALNNMSQGLAMFDAEQKVVVSNARYAHMYGMTREHVTPGTSLCQIVELRIDKGIYAGGAPEEYRREQFAPVLCASDSVHELSDGRAIAISRRPMLDGGWVTTHEDITERRRAEAKIAHMALHDTLTGLPNRVLLNERLEQALARARRGEVVAVHLLDLDHFKTVNDTLGHPAGDKLLVMVADRLRALVRETDTIARMGGDEFAVVQVAIAQPSDATSLAHRIIEVVGAPYDIEGQQVVIGTSVGIVVGLGDGLDPDQLIRNADLALYRAKGDGRGSFCFFEPEMDAQMQARRTMEHDLRKALPADEFELYYQPIVRLEGNEVVGFEALIRWRHPENGLVAPGAFIPLAEEIGFIVPLGEWAIRQACTTAATWPERFKIAVNLSPAQFRSPGLVQVVANALAASGLAPERLELEITETALLSDSEATLAILYQLRELGVRIAMDDFGTGYSSLSYLQSFPFDKIKIDRSFVKDITEGVGSLNIVRAVAALAHGLGMASTAEGVETAEQLATVRSEGCTEMQGFLFSHPLPAEDIERLYMSRDMDREDTATAA